ncbi:MAG: HAD-superfamily hydrolase, subfamily variant 1 [Herbinix sp.]|jgi:putative hydrolase of the HAD superfamily|nr:HAD-superfamily hydrolase, subfamily variant 1 [Herbinix sp.]
MNKPKMIMFDYGQTLVDEGRFDGVKATRAVLKYAIKNPYQMSAQDVQEFAKTLNRDIGRFLPDVRLSQHIEVHNHIFQKYLYDYYDVEFDLSPLEIEKIFWDNAAPKQITKHIDVLLKYLYDSGIRTAVISNISFSGKALEDRINLMLPENHFEFILATSEYVFRKPHNRIYELALRKAKLNARDVWYCGDNAYFDVEGASKSGIFPVWYKGALDEENKLTPSVDCLKVSDWLELIELFEKA